MDYTRILYSEISFVPSPHDNNINNNYNNHNGNTSNNNHLNNNNHQPRQQQQSTSSNNHHQQNNINNNHCNNNTNNNNNDYKQQQQASVPTQANEGFQAPKHQLCDPNLVKLDWQQSEKIGGGLVNVGNTCFLNSVLQCLTYCPPLYNYLVKQNGGHSSACKINQFCMLCEMEKHIKRIKSSNGAPIKPVSIVQRLKYINKSFQFGRQEDAHEFLRYVIDHMWKACLINLDIDCKNNKLDPRIKETTTINHIFGGYHRSQVLCLSCNSRSNTFDFFMDFNLDIRNSKSLEEALKRFTQAETLENENAYKCGRCRKKVVARKRFSVFHAPNVATFQVKRFDSDRIFGGKITKFISYPEELDLRPYMSDSASKLPIQYLLSAVLVHVGHSSNSGHYFCFIKNSNGLWYRMDDSNVSIVGKNVALQQQAYVLFYTRKTSDTRLIPSIVNPIERHQEKNVDNSTSLSSKISGTVSNGNVPNKISNHVSSNTAKNNNPLLNSDHNIIKPRISFLANWLGEKSRLEEKDRSEPTDRDRFNEELDRGKIKKIKMTNQFNMNGIRPQSGRNPHPKMVRRWQQRRRRSHNNHH